MVLLTFWKALGEVKELIYKSWRGSYAMKNSAHSFYGPKFNPNYKKSLQKIFLQKFSFLKWSDSARLNYSVIEGSEVDKS